MASPLIAACVQVNSGTELAPNLVAAADGIRRAADQGATLIGVPEYVGGVVYGRDAAMARAWSEAEHPGIPHFQSLARETGATLLIGSLSVLVAGGRKIANRSYLISAAGTVLAHYDKVHMFDVDLPGGDRYRESSVFEPGNQAVVVPGPWGGIGLSICYDVRFASLYRQLAQAGATILTVPAAFTKTTGEAHWHTLLRARAIETGSFVIAPAQWGTHERGRQTYGHSLIIDPWGAVLADAGEGVGVVTAELDLDRVAEVRATIPALKHDRAITPPSPLTVLQAAGA